MEVYCKYIFIEISCILFKFKTIAFFGPHPTSKKNSIYTSKTKKSPLNIHGTGIDIYIYQIQNKLF